MTHETPTPETDAAKLRLDCDDSSIAIYTHTQDGSCYEGDVCRADETARLERERDAARAEIEAMREVVAAAENCRHWHDCSYNPATGKTEGVVISADSFWELHTALAKLQPFIKP